MNDKFKNDEIEVTVKRLPNCKIELDVIAKKSCIDKAKDKATKAVSKNISMPGFRKGKVPKELISKQHSHSIFEQSKKELADIVFMQAFKLTNISLLNNNSSITFDVQNIDDNQATLTFKFETEPTIPEIDPKKFTLKETERPEVGDTQINEAIRQMQFFHATWNPVDRPIQENDYVLLDLESLETTPPTKVFSNTRFEIKDKSIAKWMKNILLGTKTGDILEGTSEPDDDLPEEEKKKFEKRKVKVTINKVEEATLPELDDEFAKKVGAQNIDEMKKSIAKLLNKQADEKVDKDKTHQVNEFLLTYDFELPVSLLETEKNYRKQNILNSPKAKKEWESMTKDQQKEAETNILKQAKEAVSLFYISRDIVKEKKLDITKDEIATEIAKEVHTPIEKLDQKIKDELFAVAFSRLVLAKAQKYILDNCTQS